MDSIAGGYGGLARMVNRGELVRVRRGVVAQPGQRPAEQVLRQRIEAAAPFLGGGTWFSHRSAAVIHGMPVLIRGGQPLIEVIRTMGGHGNRSRHLHARAAMVDADEATWVDGLPVTSLTRTVLDLVKTLPFPEAVMVTDHALRLGLTRTGLIAGVGEGKGAPKGGTGHSLRRSGE